MDSSIKDQKLPALDWTSAMAVLLGMSPQATHHQVFERVRTLKDQQKLTRNILSIIGEVFVDLCKTHGIKIHGEEASRTVAHVVLPPTPPQPLTRLPRKETRPGALAMRIQSGCIRRVPLEA